METDHDTGISEIVSGYQLNEIISESNRHVVYGATTDTDHHEIAIKSLIGRYPNKEAISGLSREYEILSKIQSAGIIKVFSFVSFKEGNCGIVMERFGISLLEYLSLHEHNIFTLDEFFPVAIEIVRILGNLHEKKVIHKDVTTSNILFDRENGQIRLIDFSSSTELAREQQNILFSGRIVGSLPYMSPEQTGRMNRDLDYRTDYYSLGITFYQLLTGQFPFHADDPLGWVHCHISVPPFPAHKINKKIPKVLSDLIGKLISKNAEDRYQSSFGLITDLEKCRDKIREGYCDFSFELAQADIFSSFQIPQQLYGRREDLQKLELHFDNAAHGSVEFCVVSGYSGVGKTALVNELGRSVAKKNGFLIQGKFEQFKQNIAYSAFADAFQNLVYELLGKTREDLDHWSVQIKNTLGNNAKLISNLVPQLELIIGSQPPVQELTPAEAQNRFMMLVQSFVKIFLSPEHPLVIFLDDLQWSDIPTLNLLNRLVTSSELGYLFIIGAYRDNAVDATHPLTMVLGEIQNKRFIENLHLKPLEEDAVNQLTKDALHCDEQQAIPLSDLVFKRSGGNPFFTIEILKNLYETGKLWFNPDERTWNWNIADIQNIEHSDNVVDFLVSGLSRLPKSTQRVLQLAACIGATFDLKTLSIISERNIEKSAADLKKALQAQLIIPLNEDYKLVGLTSPGKNGKKKLKVGENDLNPAFKFQHDKVQQAAYSMIAEEKRRELHLSIGRLMLQHTDENGINERLVSVVEHLNDGRSLISNSEERKQLANLNLKAGIRAKQSSAYNAALNYLKIGYELLGKGTWQKHYKMAWQLAEEIQHCTYLTGNWKESDEWSETMLHVAKSPVEKSLVLSARTRQYATIGKMKESLEATRQGLAFLGFELVRAPDKENITNELKTLSENLRGREIAELINLPDLVDERARIASRLFMESFAAAFLSASGEMFPYFVLKSVNIALTYGNSPETAFAYVAYGMILCGYFNDVAQGYEYGKLGVNLIGRYDEISLKSRIYYVYTMFIHHWSNHWSTMTPWFRKAIEAGYQSGDLLYLAYSAQDCIIWDPRLSLDTASKEQRKLLNIVKECEYRDSYDSGTLFLQMQLNFQGLTHSRYALTDEHFDERECLNGILQRHFMTGIANFHIYKSEIHFLYNDAGGALYHVQEQEKLMASVMSLPQLVRFCIISFLVYAALVKNEKGEKQDLMYERMNDRLQRMTSWSKQCPANFEHLRLLMKAELARLSDHITEALVLYEQSISEAAKSGFIRDEAMANELAAICLLGAGLRKAAEGYLNASCYLYDRWGAARKVDELHELNPFLLGTTAKAKQAEKSGSTKSDPIYYTTDSLNSGLLDMNSVFKASQMISGELNLDKLLKATLQVLIENAGAQKGFLVEETDGRIEVLAEIENANNGAVHRRTDGGQKPWPFNFPLHLVNTSLRTGDVIVIDDASKTNPFSSDPYIIRQQPLSVMCVPLPLHDQWKSALYLENNLTHNAFSEDRVKIIKLLAGQAAISIANARIYEEQKKLLRAQQRFVPGQFLRNLGHDDIAKVSLGESVSMEMSVLFSDIVGFTSVAEQLSPHDVIELLNDYYSRLGIPINEAGGFIDSYAGDEIMALFPVPAQQSVEVGIRMSETLRRFNTGLVEKDRAALRMGMGMNTGPLVLGTMGGQERMQCSVLGDTVNLASRIEQLTRRYDCKFLIGENTYRSLISPETFSVRLIDYVAVKGKAVAVKLYEVMDAEDDERRHRKENTKSLLEEGMEAYFNRDFSGAYRIFEDASRRDAKDPVLSIFKVRSRNYLEDEPSADWKGYETLPYK